MVLTNTSRAANDVMMPIPIFQSNPSGAITGSIARPRRPAKLLRSRSPARFAEDGVLECCSVGVLGTDEDCFSIIPLLRDSVTPLPLLGYVARNQSRMLMPRITVPARRRNNRER